MSFIPIPIQPDSGGGGGGGGDPQASRTKTPLDAAALSTAGDHFTTDTLDPAWTTRNNTPTFPYVSPGAELPFDPTDGIFRAAPAGTQYEVVATLEYLGGNSAASAAQTLGQWGVCILSAAGTGVSGGIHTADPARIWLHQITAYTYVGVYGAGLDPGTLKFNHISLALHRNGNDYRMRFSNDGGVTWSAYTAVTTVAFTPTQVGVIRSFTGGSTRDNQFVTIRNFNTFSPTFV